MYCIQRPVGTRGRIECIAIFIILPVPAIGVLNLLETGVCFERDSFVEIPSMLRFYEKVHPAREIKKS